MTHECKQMITICPSGHCNLNCDYCYFHELKVKREHYRIDLGFARSGIQDFFSTNSSRRIRYFSAGEPTTEFGVMKKTTEFARSIAGRDLEVEIQSNGYYSNSIADWVNDNATVLWISYDGLPDIQDEQRKTEFGYPTSQILLKHFPKFIENEDLAFGVRATLKEKDFHRQIEIIDALIDMGIDRICVAPAYNSVPNPNIENPPLLKFAKEYIDAFKYAETKGVSYMTHIIVNFDGKANYYCRFGIPCPQLTPDGYVSCCDWASLGPEYLPHLDELIYGKYDYKLKKIIYDQDRIEHIQSRNVENLRKGFCKGCDNLEYCAGGCVGKMLSATGSYYQATSEWCKTVDYLRKRIPYNVKFKNYMS